MATLITLLTDFGSADSYVGEVKGVLLSQVHGAALVDITHQVPPGDVRAAQYVLSRVWHRFPQGSVHLAVVDPGVGTDRRVLAASTAGHFFVAPDNGLLSFLPADAPLDRKSTRLNSSHTVISYAVFCLLKKTASLGGPFAGGCTSTKSGGFCPLVKVTVWISKGSCIVHVTVVPRVTVSGSCAKRGCE